MTHVTINAVEKAYGGHSVIHGVDLDVAVGEFVVLVGPSGCGKSTLLRMIAGLEDITSGSISIGGKIVNNVAPKDRDIAMVFQSYALYPHKTVYQNMGFALKLAGRSKSEIDDKVRKAAAMLDLSHLLERYPRELSGGQRQRVAMGRALVRDAQVFLFDEPLSNLDAKLRGQMRTEIKALHQRLQMTAVYVTHDQIEAMTMADRIVVMNSGRIEQIGSPLELYDAPRNLFVASFLGAPSMNLLEGRIINGQFQIGEGVSVPLPLSQSTQVHHSNVVLGVRPEHVLLTEPGTGCPATIIVEEPTGADTEVALHVEGQTCVATFRERFPLEPGQAVGLRFQTDKLHLFSKETGERLVG